MQPPTLSQKVYDQLHQRLRTGKLRPGTQLINRTLAAELGTSTIPVREAISRLVSEGLLDATPGGGAFVRTPDPNELGELYDVREALEVLAASEAARFSTEHLIAELRAICERLQQVAVAVPAGKHATHSQMNHWLDAEEQFHTRLAAASRNRWLVKMVKDVRVIARVFAAQRMSPQILTGTLADDAWRYHESLLEILARHDSDAAGAWMRAHIRRGRDQVLAAAAMAAMSGGRGQSC